MASKLSIKSWRKSEKIKVANIQITLTTFSEDENGDLSPITTEGVKIDGEDDCPKEQSFDCSIFKSVFVRNLLVLSFGQFLLFTAFDSLSNLQSTINSEGGVGTVSLAVFYGVLVVSSFFSPTVIIKIFGCKKTLVCGILGFCPYILANFYPTWSTLIPTAVVCGLVSGPFLSARSTYLNRISHRCARLNTISAEIMNAWFFSVCTTFQQNSEIWGNLLSYNILKSAHHSDLYLSRSVPDNCGSDFCDDGLINQNTSLQPLTGDRRYILITIYSALAFIAAFVTASFLDPLDEEESEETRETFSLSEFFATFHQFSNLDQILLLPLSLYTGLVVGFYIGDYAKAYVACAYGVPYFGAMSICYGVVSVLVDSAGGPCVQILGRSGLFFLAALAHLAMFLALILWKPDYEHTSGFFLIASAHGIGNGVWMSQLVAMYGVLFKENEEAAFSSFYFLHSLGFLLAFSYNNYLCTYVKLFIPLTVLVIGLVCYLTVEVRILKRTLVNYEIRRRDER